MASHNKKGKRARIVAVGNIYSTGVRGTVGVTE